jgi:hypothetical protein
LPFIVFVHEERVLQYEGIFSVHAGEEAVLEQLQEIDLSNFFLRE